MCGSVKEPYIQIEYRNKVEYTCEECYRKSIGEPITEIGCRACGAGIKSGDKFCGKCGAEQERACPDCGEEASDKDVFCGKCGGKL